ncbi:MAG TPA: hypothetical protein GX530_09080, partial [Corynebacteriales bacterium]|nr:hypothetical protein [Mycobacteriales bacterium]
AVFGQCTCPHTLEGLQPGCRQAGGGGLNAVDLRIAVVIVVFQAAVFAGPRHLDRLLQPGGNLAGDPPACGGMCIGRRPHPGLSVVADDLQMALGARRAQHHWMDIKAGVAEVAVGEWVTAEMLGEPGGSRGGSCWSRHQRRLQGWCRSGDR